MSLREIEYDMLTYRKQVIQLKRMYKKKRDLNRDEFISGIKDTDILMPSITVTIYYGQDSWQKPKTLMDLLNIKDTRLTKFILNKRMNLVEVCRSKADEYSNEDIEIVFDMLRLVFKKDIEAIKERYSRKLSRELALVVGVCAKSRRICELVMEERGDDFEMCRALDEWEQEVA